jgi:glycosyltransferase involved in cell wall biosynthesis
MQKLSVVIACKNEAAVIGETLKSFAGLTDDVLIYDNGSTDDTKDIVKKSGARLAEGEWEGFGKTKNKANALAKFDWILSLDADEAIDEDLKNELLHLSLTDDKTVYEMRFKNFFGDQLLRFGEWGDDKHIRLFNRQQASWNNEAVHESLVFPAGIKKKQLKGFVLHKTTASAKEYNKKMKHYALLNARKYFEQGKNAGWLTIFFSPVFSFIKNYFLKLGFLDGAAGFHCAKINASYTRQKYEELKRLATGN